MNHHKKLVRKFCFRVGLYKQGIFHDMSKYSPTEFLIGVKYYQGYRSPNIAEREEKGYTSSWLHHKGRNKHHLEYWIDYDPNPEYMMIGCEMPVKYVVEMFCDRVAASKTYKKEQYNDGCPYEYYRKSEHHYIIHKNTKKLLEDLLLMLKEQGEDKTFQYIRKELLHNEKKNRM